jgi:hypothetical protein
MIRMMTYLHNPKMLVSACHGRLAHVVRRSEYGRVARATRFSLLLALVTALSGCSASFSVGKKPAPAQPVQVTSANAQNLHTTINVPTEAQRIAEGSDPVHLVADRDGTVYVFSRDDRQVSLQYDLQSGETFTLTPTEVGTAFSADRHVGAPGRGTVPPSKGGYEVYFLKKGTPTTSPATAPALP